MSLAHQMNLAMLEEEENERKRDRKDRGMETDGKNGSLTIQNHSGETKRRNT